MRPKFASWLIALLMTCGIAVADSAMAEDGAPSTNIAVMEILFDYDADKFASYVVRDDGFLDITFARNTPDPLYAEILDKLKSHPDIKGVLAGKGGPTCSLF